jgi:hypothetical protein
MLGRPLRRGAREVCGGRTTNRFTPAANFFEGRRSETALKRSERQAVRSLLRGPRCRRCCSGQASMVTNDLVVACFCSPCLRNAAVLRRTGQQMHALGRRADRS